MRAFLERMIRTLRFVELVAAIVAFVARVCEVNGELSKKLAELRRRRPRSESLQQIERQLILPLGDFGVAPAARPNQPSGREPKSRKGRHPGRAALPAHLPRVEVNNPVPPELRVCPRCGAEMTTVGHQRCEILSVIPAKVVVEVRLDERVACPNDDTIVSAPTPPVIVERGKLSDTLIVEATADKYLEHTPIERQCTRFARLGVEIAPQTLGRSVAAHIDLLAPIARLIEGKTRGPGLLGTDATGIPVLDPDTVDGIRTGAGMMTHMCIAATTRAAADLGFTCWLAHDGTATRALTFDGTQVPADHVQRSFLSALSGTYANVQAAAHLTHGL